MVASDDAIMPLYEKLDTVASTTPHVNVLAVAVAIGPFIHSLISPPGRGGGHRRSELVVILVILQSPRQAHAYPLMCWIGIDLMGWAELV